MAKIRCDIELDGLKGIKLITDKREDDKIEPFKFYLRVRPVIEKFKKDLDKVLQMGARAEEK
ncbi:MAG: hypothetical protein ABSG71_06030 [Thermodesulfobacteriota bacterium]|jgi:hypothetical protein